ncbi:MAG TPA: helix-turn-helix transcriptional regulator [Pirellulaceae bacterium]|nr:helix-turn-helix transcriptional regulator [Pirellulaceae bacterium]
MIKKSDFYRELKILRNALDRLLDGLRKTREPPKESTISDQLRAAIRNSGKSATALAKESGVPQPMITRFLNGQQLLSGTVDRLAGHLGLVLSAKGKGRK